MYDIIYIGGGLNYAGAIVAAKNGLKVALVEKSLSQLGGVCLHKGCIPSKMFLHYAQTLHESKNSLFTGELQLDMKHLVTQKNSIIQSATKAVTAQCAGVDLIEAEAKVIAPHKVRTNNKTIEGKYIVIGTGSSPFIPEGIAYDKEHIITSDEVLDLSALPKNIAIYGDGAIGLEMASFFAGAGVRTTLISRHETDLKGAHPLIQSALKKQLQKMNIEHLTNHPIMRANSTSRGVHILFENKTSRYFEKLLVATGRRANIGVIETNEIKIEKGIVTDDHFETTLHNHYAIGDCNAKVQLAHAAKAQTLYVTQKILGNKPQKRKLSHVVRFIHTLPMGYATVGYKKSLLEEKEISFKESVVPLSQFTLSMFHDAGDGVVVLYADNEGFILGAEIFAPNAEELIAPVAMALAGEMDKTLCQKTILAHPTFSEALERAYFRL